MAIKVFAGLQSAQGVISTSLLDIGATDFNGGEKYNSIKSEVFNTLQAEGDQFLVGIETTFDMPIEWSTKILELIMQGLGYVKQDEDEEYKLSSEDPAHYTVIVSDSSNNMKTIYKDCKLNTIAINIVKGAVVNGSTSWIGKTADFQSGVVADSSSTNRGESLVALGSTINLGEVDSSSEVNSLTIDITNNLEAKGAINSLYTAEIRRNAPQATSATLEFNTYNQVRFANLKAKAATNTTENLTITLADRDKTIEILIPKLFVAENTRADYKGAGSQTLKMNASINNDENTPVIFKF